ncbi:MAG: UDP-N-acetylmuramate--L-alanine ligase [Chlorobi bacterium]|nr:UDP-N-acetylmuramate--L-alanine ligase [Chlorobiota bacterium]
MRRIHFVGIGGIGMSGLAEFTRSRGYEVTGSDATESENTRTLRANGIPVAIGHAAEHIGDADLVVYSSAVSPDTNPETLEARRRGIPLIRRSELLAHVTRLGKSLAIAGTHGKTTTTSLCGLVLVEAGFDPTVIVGGRLTDFGGSNARIGRGEWFVVEADEYDRSFLHLTPTIAVITNIEPEHLDIYGSFDAVQDAFTQFAHNVSLLGTVILSGDDPVCRRLASALPHRTITYGFSEGCTVRAEHFQQQGTIASADIVVHGEMLGSLQLRIPGKHNIANALAAVAVGYELDIPFSTIQHALSSFCGVIRRFQVLGQRNGAVVIDDYAHHPTEVRATLQTARIVYPDRRLIAIFQPHTYTRTRDFAQAFADELSAADIAIVTDVYAAREAPLEGISGQCIAVALQRNHRPVLYAPRLEDVRRCVGELIGSGDVVVTMGAGNIVRIAQWLAHGADD